MNALDVKFIYLNLNHRCLMKFVLFMYGSLLGLTTVDI